MNQVPKLPLRQRSRNNTSNVKRSGSISARDDNQRAIARAKSVMSSKSTQRVSTKIPLSARVRSTSSSSTSRPVQQLSQQHQQNSEKPHTPNGRPDLRRMQSQRIRDDSNSNNNKNNKNKNNKNYKNTFPNKNNTNPPAPISPVKKHGWGLVRERVVQSSNNNNNTKMPRTNGFKPARNKSSVTLSDQVKRGAYEVVDLKDKVSRLRNELNEKDQRLQSATKKVNHHQTQQKQCFQKNETKTTEKIYVRDEVAMKSIEHERDVAIAELKVLQTRFRTVSQRSSNNEDMLNKRILKITSLEKQMNNNQTTYTTALNQKDQQIKQITLLYNNSLLSKNNGSNSTKKEITLQEQHTTTTTNQHYIDAQALRVQVARLVKDLHETKMEHASLNKQEKLSELMNIKTSTDLNKKILIMKKTIGAQKVRILELESTMKLTVKDKNKSKNMHIDLEGQKVQRELQSKYNTLQQLNVTLTTTVQNLQTVVQKNEIKMTKDTATISTLKEKMKVLKKTIDNQKETIAVRDVTIVELTTKIQALHEEHDLHSLSMQQYETQTLAEQKVIETLRIKLTKAENDSIDMKKLRIELDVLKQNLKDTELRFRTEQSNHQFLQKKSITLQGKSFFSLDVY